MEKECNLEQVKGMIPGKYILTWNIGCTTFHPWGYWIKKVEVCFLYLVSNSNRDDQMKDNRNEPVIHCFVSKGK